MAAAGGAKIVLWQESAGFLPRHEEENFIDSARITAAREGIYLLMTLWSVPEDFPKRLVENKLIIIDPDGQIRMTYLKNNPAPPEPIKKGNGRLEILETTFGNIAPAICFDAEFPAFIRQAGQKKAGILFLPANDWKAIDPIHTDMAVLRAVENGFSLVRAAGQGLSVATDNRGNRISSMDYYRTAEQIMYADVPSFHSTTLYTRLGDWFAWFCIAGFTGILLGLVLNKYARRKPGLSIGEKTNLDLQS
jgi:apolipoprotein N-acyltransferase